MKAILAIDPGIKGAICLMGMDGTIISLHKVPIFSIPTKTKKKDGTFKEQKQIDFKGIFEIIEPFYKDYEVEAFVEEITQLFGLPPSSNFRLGYAAGVIHAALQTFGDYYQVKPRIWQQGIWEAEDHIYEVIKGQKKLQPKPTSCNCARRLFPDQSFSLKGGKAMNEGYVDATLIAEYGRRFIKG